MPILTWVRKAIWSGAIFHNDSENDKGKSSQLDSAKWWKSGWRFIIMSKVYYHGRLCVSSRALPLM